MSTPLLSVGDLHVSFGGVRVLQGVDLACRPAGNSWTHRAQRRRQDHAAERDLRHISPAAGEHPARRSVGHWTQAKRYRADWGLAEHSRARSLFKGMTVLENLMTGLHRQTTTGFLSAGLCLRRGRDEEMRTEEEARRALHFVGMSDFADRPATALSFGQQRVVEIARTLIGDPKIVLLDEPAVGLSINRLAELDALLRRIRDQKGVTLILIEHVIRLVMDVCDRVTVSGFGTRHRRWCARCCTQRSGRHRGVSREGTPCSTFSILGSRTGSRRSCGMSRSRSRNTRSLRYWAAMGRERQRFEHLDRTCEAFRRAR